MMRPLSILLLLTTVASGQTRETPSFLWTREVELPEIDATTPVAAPLDSHVFEFTSSGMPDLRLRDSAGEVVGFLIRPASEPRPRTIRTTWPAEQSSAQVDANSGVQIDLKLKDDDPIPDGIRIFTPLRNFKQQVRVEASADGFDWVSAGLPVMIFDYSSHVDARNDFVPFTAGEQRRFRVIIGDLTAEQESQLLDLHRRLQGGREVGREERIGCLFAIPSILSGVLTKGGTFDLNVGLLLFPLGATAIYLAPKINLSQGVQVAKVVLLIFMYGSLLSIVLVPNWAFGTYFDTLIIFPYRLYGVANNPIGLGYLALIDSSIKSHKRSKIFCGPDQRFGSSFSSNIISIKNDLVNIRLFVDPPNHC